jgi:hypothetical protein
MFDDGINEQLRAILLKTGHSNQWLARGGFGGSRTPHYAGKKFLTRRKYMQ